jgi:hypothetical protein
MSRQISRRANAILWVIQAMLALLFLFAGGMKQVAPAQALAQATGLPGWFMRFIGVAEITGALGLILPGMLGIKRQLSPLAAAGLIVIMTGAVVVSVLRMGVASALTPAVLAVLLAVVIRGRLERRPHRFYRRSFNVPANATPTVSLH